jgi:hypothetical protein
MLPTTAARAAQFVEEPVRDPADLPAFHAACGVATALDETLDALLAGQGLGLGTGSDAGVGLGSGAPAAWARELGALQAAGAGLAAVVVKPAALGGFEAAAAAARGAARAGVRAVVSAAFESSVALAQYAHLAAALDAEHVGARPAAPADSQSAAALSAWRTGGAQALRPAAPGGDPAAGLQRGAAPPARAAPLAHGLGTASWFLGEPAPLRLQRMSGSAPTRPHAPPSAEGHEGHGCDAGDRAADGEAGALGVSLAAAQRLWESAAAQGQPGAAAAAAAEGREGGTGASPAWRLGPVLVPDPSPRVDVRTVATAAGRFTFRAVELGCLAPEQDRPAAAELSRPGSIGRPARLVNGAAAPPTAGSTRSHDGLDRSRVAAQGAAEPSSGSGSGAPSAAWGADPRPTVLLLHGFLGAAEDWAPVAAGLAAGPAEGFAPCQGSAAGGARDPPAAAQMLEGRAEEAACCSGGWRCLALDLPGHGGSRVEPSGTGALPGTPPQLAHPPGTGLHALPLPRHTLACLQAGPGPVWHLAKQPGHNQVLLPNVPYAVSRCRGLSCLPRGVSTPALPRGNRNLAGHGAPVLDSGAGPDRPGEQDRPFMGLSALGLLWQGASACTAWRRRPTRSRPTWRPRALPAARRAARRVQTLQGGRAWRWSATRWARGWRSCSPRATGACSMRCAGAAGPAGYQTWALHFIRYAP